MLDIFKSQEVIVSSSTRLTILVYLVSIAWVWVRRVSLVRTLVIKYKPDVTVGDDENNTPLHVAALNGKEGVVLARVWL